jgi:PrcB C-terminal
MNSRWAYLSLLTGLAACASGTTMRVAQDEETDDEPVALAPVPEPAEDSAPGYAPEPTAETQLPSDSAPAQGYAAYGNATALEVRRVGKWTRTGIAEARRLVIRDANAWAELWSELGVGERPEVDFTRDMVIVVAAGQRPTGGHEITVDQVTQSDGNLTISVLETSPGPNCMTTASLTQPVDVVIVPAVKTKSWSFLEQKDVRGCR